MSKKFDIETAASELMEVPGMIAQGRGTGLQWCWILHQVGAGQGNFRKG